MKHIKCKHCGATKKLNYSDNIDGSWNCPKCGYLNKPLPQEPSPALFGSFRDKINSVRKTIDSGKEKLQSAKEELASAKERRQQEEDNRIREKEEARLAKEEEKLQKEENRRIRKEHRQLLFHRILLGSKIALLLLLLLTIGLTSYEFTIRIPVGYRSANLQDISYESAAAKLEDAGFHRIKLVALDDLDSSQLVKDGKVASIKIGFKESFNQDQKFPSNFLVTITYHTLRKIPLPFSSQDVVGSDYTNILQQLDMAGFLNVQTEVRYDIITGFLHKDTEVESVTVDGDTYFKYNAMYRPDAEIIVTYHRFLTEKQN